MLPAVLLHGHQEAHEVAGGDVVNLGFLYLAGYTTNSTYLSCTQENQFQPHYGVEPRYLTADLSFRLRSL